MSLFLVNVCSVLALYLTRSLSPTSIQNALISYYRLNRLLDDILIFFPKAFTLTLTNVYCMAFGCQSRTNMISTLFIIRHTTTTSTATDMQCDISQTTLKKWIDDRESLLSFFHRLKTMDFFSVSVCGDCFFMMARENIFVSSSCI